VISPSHPEACCPWGAPRPVACAPTRAGDAARRRGWASPPDAGRPRGLLLLQAHAPRGATPRRAARAARWHATAASNSALHAADGPPRRDARSAPSPCALARGGGRGRVGRDATTPTGGAGCTAPRRRGRGEVCARGGASPARRPARPANPVRPWARGDAPGPRTAHTRLKLSGGGGALLHVQRRPGQTRPSGGAPRLAWRTRSLIEGTPALTHRPIQGSSKQEHHARSSWTPRPWRLAHGHRPVRAQARAQRGGAAAPPRHPQRAQACEAGGRRAAAAAAAAARLRLPRAPLRPRLRRPPLLLRRPPLLLRRPPLLLRRPPA
jgi:hypothetical protein